MSKRIIISVTSDLVSDQRVHKVAQSLHQNGYSVCLVGRKKSSSQKLFAREYQTKRFFLVVNKGMLFYIAYNIRLFFYLLFAKADVFLANDLDTLLANYLIARLRNKKLVFDSHEYFTGVPELLERPLKRKIWKKIEQWIVPKVDCFYTVNESIASIFRSEYSIEVSVIRNLPYSKKESTPKSHIQGELINAKNSEKAVIVNLLFEMLRREKRKIILYQGAVNRDRGLEEAIEAMNWVENAVLLVVGNGDVLSQIRKKTQALCLHEKIFFTGNIPFQVLPYFTHLAALGLSVEKPTNVNYKFASPNKVVDYINAGVPVLASKLIEIETIVNKYQIGTFIDDHSPIHIAKRINECLSNSDQLTTWSKNCQVAASELIWENEEQKLLKLIGI